MVRGLGSPALLGGGAPPQPGTHPSPFAATSWPRLTGQPITPGTRGLAAKEEQGREQLPPPWGPALLNPSPSRRHGIAPPRPRRDPVVLIPPLPDTHGRALPQRTDALLLGGDPCSCSPPQKKSSPGCCISPAAQKGPWLLGGLSGGGGSAWGTPTLPPKARGVAFRADDLNGVLAWGGVICPSECIPLQTPTQIRAGGVVLTWAGPSPGSQVTLNQGKDGETHPGVQRPPWTWQESLR